MATLPSEGTPVLNAVTTTTTSGGQPVENLETVAVQFTCAGHASGNGVLTIDASIDGVNWYTGIAFVDAQSTTSTTAIVSKQLSSNTTFIGLVPILGFKYLRAVVTVTTDGSYTVWFNGRRTL